MSTTILGPHVLELLSEYAIGTLAEAQAREVEAHLKRCNPCARELAILDDVYAAMALALPAEPPRPELRARTLAAVQGAGSRFENLLGRVASMLDLAREQARELLARIDDSASWIPGPTPSRIIHLPAGPRVAGANCGFVRLAGGATFPVHRHLGDEHVLVLQGGFEDSDGATVHRGDEAFKKGGSEHSFTALPGIDLVYLVVLDGGIEIPSDPGFQL